MFCFPEDYQERQIVFTKPMIYPNTCKSGLTSCPIYIAELFKINLKFSLFRYSLKIFAAPFLTFNVLLLFKLNCFLPFLHGGLKKSWHCHLVFTQQSDVIPKGNTLIQK